MATFPVLFMQTFAGVGYVGGGAYGGYDITSTDGLRFSTETTYAVSQSGMVYQSPGTVNSRAAGFSSGGNASSGTIVASGIGSLTFATEVAGSASGSLAIVRMGLAGINSYAKGFFTGGVSTGGTRYSEVDGVDFSNNTYYNPSGSLSNTRHVHAGCGSSARGDIWGGYTPTYAPSRQIDYFRYDTEVGGTTSVLLANGRWKFAAVNSSSAGYWSGGEIEGGGSTYNEVDGVLFASETYNNPSVAMSTYRSGASAGTNSTARGYVSGFGTVMTTDGLVFATESALPTSLTLPTSRTLAGGYQWGAL